MNEILPLSREQAQPRVGLRRRTMMFDGLAYLLLTLGALVMLGPFVWMVATALKQPADQFSRSLIPNPPTLENFTQLWQKLPFTRLILNSLTIAALTTSGQLLTCAMGAFCFAVVRFRLRGALFVALLATLMIPPQVT